MLLALNAHRRTAGGVHHRDVVGQKRVGLFCIYLFVVLRLIHVESIGGAVPHVGLRCHLAGVEPCRHPALQVGTVGILLEHIQKVLRLRILVVALVHHPVAHSCVYRQRLVGLLRYEVDYRTCGTAAIQGAAGPLHYLHTVDGVEVEALVVEIARHIARHALSIHKEKHVACIQSLHRNLVAETYLLYVQSRRLLLKCLLQVAVSCLYQLFAAKHLGGHCRQLQRTGCLRAGYDHFVQSQGILLHVDGLNCIFRFDDSRGRHKTDIVHLIIVCRVADSQFHFRRSLCIGDGMSRILHILIIGIRHDG